MAEKKGSEEELIRSLEIPVNIPLYVSIDKDVLCQEEAATTWSQGDMTLEEMLKVFWHCALILKKRMEKSCRWISAGNVIRIRVWKVLKMIMQTRNFYGSGKNGFEWRE